ncbi:MAG: hypothetical protein H3Z50_02890 [archaeon]|nr:hypothetical protein [archaeon]MCP8306830.1 hypothetical protein [archaeon]
MGVAFQMKTYTIQSKIGDSLKVRIEKVGAGEGADIIYRIIRGEDRRNLDPDKVMLYKEELEQLIEFLKDDFLKKEFPDGG